MAPDPEIEWTRLADYFVGVATPADRRAMENWMAADPAHRALVERLRQLWVDAAAVPAVDAAAGWEAVAAHLVPAETTAPAAPSRVTPSAATTRHRWTSRPAVAAAAVVVIAGGAALALGLHIGKPAAGRAYVTGPAERETVTLGDGSRVTLGPESRVRLAAHYGTAARDVALEGEAYFDVHHDSAHPLTVHAGALTARDIGTRFVVRRYAGDEGAQVAVEEGQVAVRTAGAAGTRSLGVGDLARVTAAGAVTVLHRDDLAPYLAWIQGHLAFDDSPLPQVVADLARTFDLEIRIADSALDAETITGAFGNETADQVLDAITRSIGAEYVRHGRVVVIRSGTAAAGHRGVPPRTDPLTTVQRTSPRE